MAEAVDLEKAGIPTVVVAGKEFMMTVKFRKEALGMPSLGTVTVPFPIGPAEEARQKADDALPEIVAILTDQKQRPA